MDTNHQFSLEVLGVHICSFWADKVKPIESDGGLWFANAYGESVLTISSNRPGIVINERVGSGSAPTDWRRVEWPQSVEVSV